MRSTAPNVAERNMLGATIKVELVVTFRARIILSSVRIIGCRLRHQIEIAWCVETRGSENAMMMIARTSCETAGTGPAAGGSVTGTLLGLVRYALSVGRRLTLSAMGFLRIAIIALVAVSLSLAATTFPGITGLRFRVCREFRLPLKHFAMW